MQPGGAPNRIGECRRLPPVMLAQTYTESANENVGRYNDEVCSRSESVWPETASDEWCGEYKPNP